MDELNGQDIYSENMSGMIDRQFSEMVILKAKDAVNFWLEVMLKNLESMQLLRDCQVYMAQLC